LPLTAKQRAHLKSVAHHLKPTHQIGREGLSDATARSLLDAFANRELIKIRVQDAAPLTAREAGPAIAERLPEVEHVQTIGRVVVLYRRHPETPELLP
jgi:RNA-binding protein